MIAFFALLVGAVSVFFTYQGLKKQERHNTLSVVPLPFIALADYENLIRVKIRNDGVGPMIVQGIDFIRHTKTNLFSDLVSYCPETPHNLSWKNFSSGYVRSIRAGDELILIEIEIDEVNPDHREFRQKLRSILSEITVSVRYTDVYDTPFEPVHRRMDFFSRRLASSKVAKKA